VFPLEFPFIRAIYEPAPSTTSGFVVGAMVTSSYNGFAERLAASCRDMELPLALFEVPHVHTSVSPNGSHDLRYTKPNFIHFLLTRYKCPILYLDADCVVVQPPTLIRQLLAERIDFSIFNWLAEEHTEAYVPFSMPVREASAQLPIIDPKRFYRFSHSVDGLSDSQIICSGAVQWYGQGYAARQLLQLWHGVIERSPGCEDDCCLDWAYNNYPATASQPRCLWLKKNYSRYAWWIYEAPVIDHPQFPGVAKGFVQLNALDGKPRVHAELLRPTQLEYILPKDRLIDVQTRTLLRMHDGAWHADGTFSTPLWLPPTGIRNELLNIRSSAPP
jgi:hypothetical protein